jgi:Tfp pilus assembly protein FimT
MTLTELVTILAIIGIVTAFTVPRVVSLYDRARLEAMVRGARVRVEFHADSLRAVLEDGSGAVVLARGGPSRHGVGFTASRSVIRIHPNGLGAGGANTKLVVRRGAAAESLTTSRLGRLRWR